MSVGVSGSSAMSTITCPLYLFVLPRQGCLCGHTICKLTQGSHPPRRTYCFTALLCHFKVLVISFFNSDLVNVVRRDEETHVNRGTMCSVGIHHSLPLHVCSLGHAPWALRSIGPGGMELARLGVSLSQCGTNFSKAGGDSPGKLYFLFGPELALNTRRMFEHMRNAILRNVNNPGHLSCPPFFLFKSLLTNYFIYFTSWSHILLPSLLPLPTHHAFLLLPVPPLPRTPFTPPLSLFRKVQASYGYQQNKTHQVEAVQSYPPASRMDYSQHGE